jgi:HSP20 family protein
MGNIDVRKNDQGQLVASVPREWDPMRVMRSLLTWDPFREMAPIGFDQPMAAFAPAFEIKETRDGYVFKAEVPGVKREDIDVSYAANRLTITGKREAEKQEKHDTFYTYERSYGSFTRAFTMPEGIDATGIHADLRDGVLSISVTKKPEAQPKKIAVSTPQEKPKA